jgi:hypothetical protein
MKAGAWPMLLLLGLSIGSFAAEQSGNGTAVELKAALSSSEAILNSTKQGRGVIEVRQPGIPFGSVRGFDTQAVETDIQRIRDQVFAELKREDMVALNDYAREYFPTVDARTFEVPQSADTRCSIAPCPKRLLEPEGVEIAFGQIYSFVGKLAASTAYKVTFKVRSKPSGAKFTLQALGGGFITEIATDGSVGNIYRGLYRYKVQHTGFKSVEAQINLVDNSPGELYCELTEMNSNNESLPCLYGIIE